MRVPESEFSQKIKLPPFLTKQALKQANQYTCYELESIMLELSRLDLEVKFHGGLSRLMLENLFQKICLGFFGNSKNSILELGIAFEGGSKACQFKSF